MSIDKVKLFLASFSLLLVNYCSAQLIKKQDTIPINNSTGVPSRPISGSVPICGFDVDSTGDYYFVGGNYLQGTTVLAVFKGNKEKYRKIYNTYFADKILIRNSKIYLFYSFNSLSNPKVKSNTLYVLDTKDGKIIKKYLHLFNYTAFEYQYVDSLIVLGSPDTTKPYWPSLKYTIVNLKGKFIGKAKYQNTFNLPDSLELKQYLGRWNKLLLYCSFDVNTKAHFPNGNYKFYFKDVNEKNVNVTTIDYTVLGWPFPENQGYFEEYIEFRNGSIFVLGRKDHNVIITELSVEELYKDALLNPSTDVK